MERLDRSSQNAARTKPETELDPTEKEVLRLMGEGFGNKKIAEFLEMSRNAVARVRIRVDEKRGLKKGH